MGSESGYGCKSGFVIDSGYQSDFQSDLVNDYGYRRDFLSLMSDCGCRSGWTGLEFCFAPQKTRKERQASWIWESSFPPHW
jgi:hypothetical protein